VETKNEARFEAAESADKL